jgi:hypothetical protein
MRSGVGLRIAPPPLVLPAMKEAEAYSPPGVGLPNVAHDRGHGITSILVYCAADLVCAHWRVFTFVELAMPDELPVIHIPRVRRFVCSKCGSRKVQARSEWPAAFGRGSPQAERLTWATALPYFTLFYDSLAGVFSPGAGKGHPARQLRSWGRRDRQERAKDEAAISETCRVFTCQ